MSEDEIRKNLVEKFNMPENFFESFSDDAVCFLIRQKPRRLEFYLENNSPRICFKGVLIKEYFVTSEHKSSKYKIKSGKLYLTLNRLENYISKKKLND